MRVYLAGPIHGARDPVTWRSNITRILPANWEAVNPLHYAMGTTARELVRTDLELILGCHAVIVWAMDPSWGAAIEIAFARSMGIHVIAILDANTTLADVSPWLAAHVDFSCNDIKTASEILLCLS